jgi:hypothetical protein
MHNRFARAFYGMAAGVAVVTSLGLIGAGAASAATAKVKPDATPPCGGSCYNPYNAKWGPNVILSTPGSSVGAKVNLRQADNSNPGQDWTSYFQGSVWKFYHYGLVSGNLAFHYGNEPAFEAQWSPYGVNTGLCAGTRSPAKNGLKVTLQECGNGANTVWVVDTNDAAADPNSDGYFPIIAGSTTNFSQPQVLTAGTPYWTQATTQRLQTYSTTDIANAQLWLAFPGTITPIARH